MADDDTPREADPDAADVLALLDRIPGAWERIAAGLEDARAGRTIEFDEPAG